MLSCECSSVNITGSTTRHTLDWELFCTQDLLEAATSPHLTIHIGQVGLAGCLLYASLLEAATSQIDNLFLPLALQTALHLAAAGVGDWYIG